MNGSELDGAALGLLLDADAEVEASAPGSAGWSFRRTWSLWRGRSVDPPLRDKLAELVAANDVKAFGRALGGRAAAAIVGDSLPESLNSAAGVVHALGRRRRFWFG